MAGERDTLTPQARRELLARKRPDALAIAPHAPPGKRRLPLAAAARDIDRQARPIYAIWEVTLRCDQSCRHCGSRAGRPRPAELSTRECLELVEQMAELGVLEVTLIGGEAYLREDWTQIVEACAQHGMTVNMTTGGRGVSLATALQAKQAGLDLASVSLDGLCDVHDRLRATAGSFDAALAAMAAFKAAGITVANNTQINRLNLTELPDILELIARHGSTSWQIQLTVPMGRAADEPEVLLQPYDLLKLFPLLGELKTRADELGVQIWPANNIGYFGPYEAVLRAQLPFGHWDGCGAGRALLGIEADGSIKGCPSLPSASWTGGNVRDASLKDIWERAQALRYTRDRTHEDLWGFCRTCYYAETCRAGCTWTAFVTMGRAGNNPYCHHRALQMQRSGKRERLQQIEPAPGLPFDHGRFEIVVEDLPASEHDQPIASMPEL